MNHAIRANYARIAVAHPEVACWRPSAGPTGASGRSDSGQTAAAPPEGVWCSCEALAWRHKIRCEKIPPFPESARAFTAALGAPRAAFPSSVACGTPPRVICVSVRGVGATARRAVDLHPALFSLLCRERVDGCGQSWQHCHMRAAVDPAAPWIRRSERSTSLRGPSRRPPRARTSRSASHGGQPHHVYAGCVGEDTKRGGPACSRQRPGSGDHFTASQAGSSATTGHSREPAAG